MNIIRILEIDEMVREQTRVQNWKKRELFNKLIHSEGRHFCGIIGPRGVGKSTLLKQLALDLKDSLYMSLDSVDVFDLFDMAKILYQQYKIRTILIDEIHFNPHYSQQLKTIYDTLDIRVIFTSSVALSLADTASDLSRRVKLFSLHPFSYREYLHFNMNMELAPVSVDDLVEGRFLSDHLKSGYKFDDYLKGGLMPFSLEERDIIPLMQTVLDRIITKDIPRIHRLLTDELDSIRKCVDFIGKSAVDGINYTSLSKNVGITKYKAIQYISLLSAAFVLNPVFPKGTNVMAEPKVLMALPFRLLYDKFDNIMGPLREDFFVQNARMRELTIHYLKTKTGRKTPDYLILQDNKKIIIEIGGTGKGYAQFKGIKSGTKIILSHPGEFKGLHRPLFLAGFY